MDSFFMIYMCSYCQQIRSWLPDASSSTVVTPFTVHCQSKSKTDVTCHLIDIVQEKVRFS